MLCYAKSLQSCPTLCDPIEGSPPGSVVPGKKSVHHRPLVPGRKLDTEEISKQKKLKQREPPWK